MLKAHTIALTLIFLLKTINCEDEASAKIISAKSTHHKVKRQIPPKGPCPCEDKALCNPMIVPYRKEVFVFAVSNKNFKMYDWTKITTVVMVGFYDAEMMCYAHKNGAKAVKIANFPVANLTRQSDIAQWVDDQISYVFNHYLDGVNVDFESPIPKDNETLLIGLRNMVGLMQVLFIEAGMSSAQITFDVPWSPDCIDGRCYDVYTLSKITNFLFVMSYDEQSQIFGECKAGANSGINKTMKGLERFQAVGVPPGNLVLGVPWYGYMYPCVNLTGNDCFIKHIPFRGVNCSDAAGTEKDYNTVMKYLAMSKSGMQWSEQDQSPFFNYQDPATKTMYQFWYDNPKSLKLKYNLVNKYGLHGVGMWNADTLDYSDTPQGKKQREDMWGALPDYKKDYWTVYG